MIACLIISGERVLQFCSDSTAFALMSISHDRHTYLKSFGTIRESTEGETPNASPTLTADAIPLFDDPPTGALATYKSEAGDEFVGTVQSVKITADGVTIEIQQ